MGMTKGQRKYEKRQMGFEMVAPTCATCVHYRRAATRATTCADGSKVQYYLHAQCEVGGFIVEAHSLCNHWISRKGETLQP